MNRKKPADWEKGHKSGASYALPMWNQCEIAKAKPFPKILEAVNSAVTFPHPRHICATEEGLMSSLVIIQKSSVWLEYAISSGMVLKYTNPAF